MKKVTIDKLINRLDHINEADLQRFFLKLAEQQGFFQQVFESLQEGLLLLDGTGHIIFANQTAHRFFNKENELLTREDFDSILGRVFSWDRVLKSKAIFTQDVEIFYPEHRYLNIFISPIGNSSQGHLMLIRDETHQHQQNEEHLEAERMNALTLLAAGVAHEIGNPLNSISLHLQLLRRKLKNLPAEYQNDLDSLLQTTEKETKRLDCILKQFLQAIRPTKPQREPYNIEKVLQDVVDLLSPEIKQRGINIAVKLPAKLPFLLMDPVQMKQVFYNLIKNAYQAIPNEGGSVLITGGYTDEHVFITIADSGSGIQPEVMGCLYEPFMTTKSGGSGLGLLIVRRIVKEHGGSLSLISKPGQGTTVTVTLPRAERHVRLLPDPTDS